MYFPTGGSIHWIISRMSQIAASICEAVRCACGVIVYCAVRCSTIKASGYVIRWRRYLCCPAKGTIHIEVVPHLKLREYYFMCPSVISRGLPKQFHSDPDDLIRIATSECDVAKAIPWHRPSCRAAGTTATAATTAGRAGACRTAARRCGTGA